ncbi:acetyl-coenzyme A synthetase 2 [Batrachochytrium dendrobatidis]|nr:acetyl-coenzyme A synthetase 2 [Batrachochytrium dendrobatidis]KAK5671725.1 acetyl-coenzyme A synthetase 2 [Batrachochytrium dendrobatidis]
MTQPCYTVEMDCTGDPSSLIGPSHLSKIIPPPVYPTHKPHLASFEDYKTMHTESISNPEAFFGKLANELLTFSHPFSSVKSGGFKHGDIAWFQDGELNVSYNCVDRHALANPDKIAIIWEADEPGEGESWTYLRLQQEVCRFANLLIKYGARKGDVVAIYMPMLPETAVAMLACARLGVLSSVIFAGFSAEALRDRIIDANCKILITTDQGKRCGKVIHLKKIADQAVSGCPCINNVIVFQRTGDIEVPFSSPRDVWWHEEMRYQRPYCPAPPMSSEDPLFILYTSGSTGKPKGVVHTQAGYLLGAAATCKYVFDVHPNDIIGCMADVGWITGHTYIVYGPLCLGVTTVIFESTPVYPNPGRYWDLVDKHQVTQFYTAPTAIRALRSLGDEPVKAYKLDSLRVLGSVGEPINPEAWLWYYEVVGRKKCMVVDTYWQTETGSHLVTPITGVTPTKPGAATFPFFGIDTAILDPTTGKELEGNGVTGVLAIRNSFPSIARTIYNDHQRFVDTYFKPYPGFYFTGDGATRDEDGFIWINGRLDDVINVSGHRLSTAEIEAALILHPACSEAAVIGIPHDIFGQAIVCFCTLKSHGDIAALEQAFITQVRTHIGPFATPQRVVIVADLPKTRSGKIMRRILRKVATKEVSREDADNDEVIHAKLGDLSTLADPSIVKHLIAKF